MKVEPCAAFTNVKRFQFRQLEKYILLYKMDFKLIFSFPYI